MFGDDFMLALTMWREARGEGNDGMQAVGCVIRNRVKRYVSSYYHEATKKWQFSCDTAPGDPELILYPQVDDPQWQFIQGILPGLIDGTLADNTDGATSYFNPHVVLPTWAKSMIFIKNIGNHAFYKAAQ